MLQRVDDVEQVLEVETVLAEPVLDAVGAGVFGAEPRGLRIQVDIVRGIARGGRPWRQRAVGRRRGSGKGCRIGHALADGSIDRMVARSMPLPRLAETRCRHRVDVAVPAGKCSFFRQIFPAGGGCCLAR